MINNQNFSLESEKKPQLDTGDVFLNSLTKEEQYEYLELLSLESKIYFDLMEDGVGASKYERY